MEVKQITGIFIDYFHDTVMGLSYGKILTFETLLSIRFPTLLENYKYKHLIQPTNLLTIEVVKTRKNWILKSVISHKVIYIPKQFQDYIAFSEIINVLKDNLRENQDTVALQVMIEYLKQIDIENISPFDFQKILYKCLGFG